MRKGCAVMAALVGSMGIVGCSGPQARVEQPQVVSKTTPATISEGQEVPLWERPTPAPCWIDDLECIQPKPGYMYFIGISAPNPYEPKAFEDALDQASREIAQHLFNMVDETKVISESLRNSLGYVPVQTLARDNLATQAKKAVIRGQYAPKRYTQYKAKQEQGAVRYFYVIIRLVEFPREEVAKAVSDAKEAFQEEMTRQLSHQEDAIKRQLLKENERLMDAMKAKVLGTAGQAPQPSLGQ